MFSSKGLFSKIGCPYNGECVLPNCLFAHSSSSIATSQPVAVPLVFTQDKAEVEDSQGEDGQRKRRKLNEALPLEVLPNGKIPPVKLPDEEPVTLPSVKRQISPPPLRRSADGLPKTTVKDLPSSSSLKPILKHGTVQANVASKVQIAKVEKVETLNPRLLRQSPASHNIRFKLVQALHTHFVRLNDELKKDTDTSKEPLILSDQQLITMALDIEEKAVLEKPTIYQNVVKNNILLYKRMSGAEWKIERRKEYEAIKAIQAGEATRSQKEAEAQKELKYAERLNTGLSEEAELVLLPKLFAQLDGLAGHGYCTSVPIELEIEKARAGMEAAKGWEICDRCRARFQVFPGRREEDGALTTGGNCTYHWGKPFWTTKRADDPLAKREKKFKCCGQSMGDTPGCTTGDMHVFKVSEVKRLAAIMNFKNTPENDTPSQTPVCIDGEMGYTVNGLELIRLTATSWPSGKELLDVLVRPIGEVLDLNTRWSGVSPQQLADALPWINVPDATSAPEKDSAGKLRVVSSPAAARELLFKYLSPTTPLIGHSLENDLNATRIVHPTIIDTALVYPHRAGLPYRNALRTLVETHLGRQIQVIVDGKADGHDSKEDANAAGDLVKFAVKTEWEKMMREGWRFLGGKLVPPPGLKFDGSWSVLEDIARGENKRSAAEMSTGDIEEGEVASQTLPT